MAAAKPRTTKKKTTRKKPGPAAFKPSQIQRAVVSALISANVPQRTIAAIIGIAYSTLQKRFKSELEATDGKVTTGVAINTLVDLMLNAESESVRYRTAAFWLRTRENELFSERRIQENIDRQSADELGKISDEEARRIAANVLDASEQNESARATFPEPTIDDEPAGTA